MKHFFEQWLDEQTDNSINNEEVKDIFEESIKCYKIGTYRAAIVMAFNGFQIVIKNRIVNDKDKIISELQNKDNTYKELENKLNKYLFNDEDKWENELKDILSEDRFFKIFSISTKNTIYKEWELWRSRRNTGAHGKPYKLISADVEAFYSWIQQSLNILYPFTHIDSILEEIDKYFYTLEYSQTKSIDYLLNHIIVLKGDDLNKILNRLYDCYNSKHDNRIFDIISKLLYDFRHKNNVSFFILNKLEELNNKGDSDNVFIQNYLLYDNNIIKSFEISDNVDYYTYYSNII